MCYIFCMQFLYGFYSSWISQINQDIYHFICILRFSIFPQFDLHNHEDNLD